MFGYKLFIGLHMYRYSDSDVFCMIVRKLCSQVSHRFMGFYSVLLHVVHSFLYNASVYTRLFCNLVPIRVVC